MGVSVTVPKHMTASVRQLREDLDFVLGHWFASGEVTEAEAEKYRQDVVELVRDQCAEVRALGLDWEETVRYWCELYADTAAKIRGKQA